MSLKTTLATGLVMTALLAPAAYAKTMVYCSEGSPEGFDPALYTAGTTFNASSHPVYNRLVEFQGATTATKPALAESWEVSEDGLTYTFKIREGQKFASGNPLTAEDVAYSLIRAVKIDKSPSFILTQFGFKADNVEEKI